MFNPEQIAPLIPMVLPQVTREMVEGFSKDMEQDDLLNLIQTAKMIAEVAEEKLAELG